nr:MAG TPA: hypothetical protein [Caudoviricetes sp.]
MLATPLGGCSAPGGGLKPPLGVFGNNAGVVGVKRVQRCIFLVWPSA